MRWYKVKIVFMDDKTIEVGSVEEIKVINDVLHLNRYRPYSGGVEHLGSYPLVNIRAYYPEEVF